MGISRMEKVLLLVHRSEKEDLVRSLQEEGILHITNLGETPLREDFPDIFPAEEVTDRDLEELITRLKKSLDYLDQFAEKGFLGMGGGRVMVSEDEYLEITSTYDPHPVLKSCEDLDRRRGELGSERNNLTSQIELLTPWVPMDLLLEEIGPTKEAVSVAGVIPSGRGAGDAREKLAQVGATCEIVNQDLERVYCLVAHLKGDDRAVGDVLKELEFESVDFQDLKGRPTDILAFMQRRLNGIDKDEEVLIEESTSLAEERPKVSILYDHYSNLLRQRKVDNLSLATREVVGIEGWVRKKDYGRLDSSVSRCESATLSKAEPYPGESPPIDLENRRPLKPFEVITELYGMPHHQEYDPTPLLAPFFALFFALCLTDAAYGILLAGLAFFMMKKMVGGGKLLKLLFISGLVTVGAGAITGGWFGDGFQRMPFAFLKVAREKMLLFDPMVSPMTFLILVIGLGYFQILFGLCVGFVDGLRRRDAASALTEKLPFIVISLSIISLIVGLLVWVRGGGEMGAIMSDPSGRLRVWAPLGLITLSLLVLVFLSVREGSPFERLFFGLYNAFTLIFYMGDILSYLRLMALGMVTAGIAMAVNVIAGLARQMLPVVGVVVAAGILVGGHLFNMGINTLGGFVHTLRLQYVEFFPKFFKGGGSQFKPFRREWKYTLVK